MSAHGRARPTRLRRHRGTSGQVIAVRSRRAPGWFLPVAGGLLFALLIGVVLTSAVWYIGVKG